MKRVLLLAESRGSRYSGIAIKYTLPKPCFVIDESRSKTVKRGHEALHGDPYYRLSPTIDRLQKKCQQG